MEDDFIRYNSGAYSTWVTEKKNIEMGPHFVYILECEENKMYCGVTKSIIKRLIEHITKRNGSVFTKNFPPIGLIHLELLPSYRDAINLETEIWGEVKSGARKKDDEGHCVMRGYMNIYIIVQDLLSRYDSKWVLRKLEGIEAEARESVF
jgi:predicted GIY-YIG superfamily endonuclease